MSLKLEMMLRLCYKILAVRGLARNSDVRVDDHFATFEWGAGGITHLRCLLWLTHSPRIDNAAKDEKARQSCADKGILLVPEVAEVVSDYFRYFASETHPLKPQSGEENKLGAAHKSKKADDAKTDPSSTAWAELREFLEGNNPDSDDSFDERLQMVGNLADFSNMHDWREPFPGGVPSRGQSCAKFAKGHRALIPRGLTAGSPSRGNRYRLEVLYYVRILRGLLFSEFGCIAIASLSTASTRCLCSLSPR